MSNVRVSEQELLRFSSQIFQAVGVPEENALLVADNLVQGELHGLASHGVSRLLSVYAERFAGGGINPHPQVTVVRRDRGCALLDGDNGPGAVVGTRAMALAIELAREHGSGWVAVRNSSHYGAAFLYAREAVAQGMIGFASTNTVVQMAPFGGREKMLGTNPLHRRARRRARSHHPGHGHQPDSARQDPGGRYRREGDPAGLGG